MSKSYDGQGARTDRKTYLFKISDYSIHKAARLKADEEKCSIFQENEAKITK